MFDIPYWSLVLAYLIGVIVFVVWAFFYLFLMTRFGLFDARGKFYLLFFMIFTVINLGLVILALLQIDWTQTFTFPPSFSSLPSSFPL